MRKNFYIKNQHKKYDLRLFIVLLLLIFNLVYITHKTMISINHLKNIWKFLLENYLINFKHDLGSYNSFFSKKFRVKFCVQIYIDKSFEASEL